MADEKVKAAMEQIEEFYFGDAEDSGEAIFNKFAAKHAALFETEADGFNVENKLEYTEVYNEF